MDLATVLRWTTERYPRRKAIGGKNPLTYGQWDLHTDRLSRALADSGVRPGERVVLLLDGGEPMASLHLAVQKLGAVSVPLSFRYSRQELSYCIGDAEAAAVITDASTDAIADAALSEHPGITRIHSGQSATSSIEGDAARQPDSPVGIAVSEKDLSVILYTSGTTGKPKGVPRTHGAEYHAAIAHLLQTHQAQFDTTLGVMPMFHTMGLRTLLSTIVAAGTWVPEPRFDADGTLELLDAEGVDALYLVPTMYWSLARTGRLADTTSVRKLAYAGAPMTPALAEQLTAALHPEAFVNHFGSTEIYTFTIGPDVAAKPGSAGRAGVFSRVRLVDPTPGAPPDATVAPGEQGQVAVSMESPEAFAGYWHRPDSDAKSIRDGWYFPGDLAVSDDDGDLWVAGRVDDMINSGGENIYPGEIEDALVRCDSVRDVVVVGIADDRWGQAVTAFCVPEQRMSPENALSALHDYLLHRSGLPSLKRPKRLIAVEAIPKSGVGKLLRRELTSGNYRPLAERDVAAHG